MIKSNVNMKIIMRSISSLFIIISLLLSQHSFSEPKIEIIKKESLFFKMPNVGKLRVILYQKECFQALCDTTFKVKWKIKGGNSNQQLLKNPYPYIDKVWADEDGLIISSIGNRYSPDGYNHHVRYRYSHEKNIFYEAEIWETDSWTDYINELNKLLKTGAFDRARKLVSEKGITPNGGHTFQDKKIFSKFVVAIAREAKRAAKLGYNNTPGDLVHSLFSMPFQHDISSSPSDLYILFKEHKGNKSSYNILDKNDENMSLIKVFSIYLENAGFKKCSASLLSQL